MAEENKINANISVGLTEGEITEHSIRKVMECLIQDFPFSSGTFDESMNASKAATNLDESQNIDKATTVIN